MNKIAILALLLTARCGLAQTSAPTPAVPLPSGYTLAFDDEFNEGGTFWNQDVSTGAVSYPNEPWYFCHTPSNVDFSNFKDPSADGFPFSGDAATALVGRATFPQAQNGILTITGWKDNGGNEGGLLSTVDQNGKGFSCSNGYWEAKIWLPPNPPGSTIPGGDFGAPGLWPAFWLDGVASVTGGTFEEIDIIEGYSDDYRYYFTTLHEYDASQNQISGDTNQNGPYTDLSQGWHIYSCLITPATTFFYFDGMQVASQGNPASGVANLPMLGMINLAYGGGWPIDTNFGAQGSNGQYANLILMQVAYLRVWAQNGSPAPTPTTTPSATPSPSSTPTPSPSSTPTPTSSPTPTPTPTSTPGLSSTPTDMPRHHHQHYRWHIWNWTEE